MKSVLRRFTNFKVQQNKWTLPSILEAQRPDVQPWTSLLRAVSSSSGRLSPSASSTTLAASTPEATEPGQVRLTQLSHGGGCGCKIAPSKLQEILRNVQLDFDDPWDFGRVAAANSISDVYAMGGRPLLALSVLGMPVNKLPPAVISRIVAGGAEVCRQAGIPLAGGHSIDSPEPIFGLVVAGLAHPDHIRANSTGMAGDVLVLTKPLGVGAMTTAIKKGLLDDEGYKQVIGTMTQLNSVGAALSADPRVHAMTDVTGFGLLGHLLEVCGGSGLHGRVTAGAVPLMGPARGLAAKGVLPGAVQRNWDSYGASVSLGPGVEPWLRDLMVDPQTSGGLLLAVEPGAVGQVMETVREAGFGSAAVVGCLEAPGEGRAAGQVSVEP
ncbi:hypothetical protein PLESTM_000544500 [Pleodorina starrii]|nr:hypothetical protein PLESTM_000544500 [Pleodorina starrii]